MRFISDTLLENSYHLRIEHIVLALRPAVSNATASGMYLHGMQPIRIQYIRRHRRQSGSQGASNAVGTISFSVRPFLFGHCLLQFMTVEHIDHELYSVVNVVLCPQTTAFDQHEVI